MTPMVWTGEEPANSTVSTWKRDDVGYVFYRYPSKSSVSFSFTKGPPPINMRVKRQ